MFGIVLPRVGFSWQAHQGSVFRGGFGIYSYNWSLDTYGGDMGQAFGSRGSVADNTNGQSPVVVLSSDGNTPAPATGKSINSFYIPASTDPASRNGQGVNYTQFHTPVPKIYQWNFGMQQELGTNMVAEVTYVASHGFDLNFPVDINQVPEALLSNDDQGARPHTNFGNINGSTNNAISNYNSLQAAVRRRLSGGLSFDANYTWSHFMSDQDSSGWGSRGGSQFYQRAYDPHANYGNSNFDVRNALKARVVWEVPVGHGRRFLNNNYAADLALGGWQAAATIVAQSGVPFTPLVGGTDTSNSQANGDHFRLYPNLIGNPQLANRSIQHWFNEAAYEQPAPFTFGNVHRNSLVGPNLSNVNFSLGKNFHLYERGSLQIRADATNILNHPGFGTPNQYLNQGSSGFVTGSSTITSTTIGGRTMQLDARFSF